MKLKLTKKRLLVIPLLIVALIAVLILKLYQLPITTCDFLIYPTIRPNGDVVELKRDICLGELAWETGNWRYCQKHSYRSHCLEWMAIKTGNLELCALKTEPTGYFWIENRLREGEKQQAWLYDCYRAMANWRNDPSICDKIPYRSVDLLQNCKETAANWSNHYSQFTSSPI